MTALINLIEGGILLLTSEEDGFLIKEEENRYDIQFICIVILIVASLL